MAGSATFTTSDGTRGRTQTSRRYVVVRVYTAQGAEPKVVILYRTNDYHRAVQYAGRLAFTPEVIDLSPRHTHTGPALVVYPPSAQALARHRPIG